MTEYQGQQVLPAGVRFERLRTSVDSRGAFTEVFRASWPSGVTPVQWNAVFSEAGVLRGVHVHVFHSDYLMVLKGRASIGLRDLRPQSPTEGKAALLELSGDNLTALTIPTGVAHGFYFHEPALHLYAVSSYWDPADELGCHWSDPALEIAWPVTSPIISERDAGLPPLREIVSLIPPFSAQSV